MFRLYGFNRDGPRGLVATFDSEAQLLAYVGWATLKTNSDGTRVFEQGSALVGRTRIEYTDDEILTDEDDSKVEHNPTPSML